MSTTERKRLAPGLWMEGGLLHLEVQELLEHLGLADTEANRQACVDAARRAWREQLRPGKFDVYDVCGRCGGQGRVFSRPFPCTSACPACNGTGEVCVGH